jgi:hypothetical protein
MAFAMSGLLSKIEARENELRQVESVISQAEHRKGVLAVELALLRELKAEADSEAKPDDRYSKETDYSEPSGKRGMPGSNMSTKWKCVVVAAVKVYPASVHNDRVPEIQRTAGEAPANQAGIRSHVSTFKTRGLYEKTGIGSFRATQHAADLVGMPLGAGASESPKGEPGPDQPRPNFNT